MTSLSQFFLGSPGRFEQLPTETQGQQDLMQQLIQGLGGGGFGQGPLGQGLGSGLQNLEQLLGGSPEAFEAFQAPARTAFQQRTVPQIAERFTGAEAQRSSAFGQQLGQAGAGLEENLAAQRAGLQSQSLQQLMQLLQQSQQPQFQTAFRPQQPGLLQGLLGGLSTGLGQVGGLGLGKLFGL